VGARPVRRIARAKLPRAAEGPGLRRSGHVFGAGLLVSLLPFVILLSAFASQRIDDDISLRLGLDRRAAGIVDHLFTSAPATLNAATATSLVFLVFGMLAVASSLQQIYEKVFRQDHRGLRDLGRLSAWIAVLCVTVVVQSVAERPVSAVAAGGWLAPLVTVTIMTPFFWWTMHFLLAGRVRWRTLLPPAIITGIFFGALGVFSKFYFSDTIISDSKTYGTIGAIFGIMTWFIAIGAVIILGAVAGAVWEDQKNQQIRARWRPCAVQPVLILPGWWGWSMAAGMRRQSAVDPRWAPAGSGPYLRRAPGPVLQATAGDVPPALPAL
jgi:membrane protein